MLFCFDRVRDQLWSWLPGPVRRLVPATMVGYLLINGFTFAVDVAMLSLAYRVLGLPYPVALSIGYVLAFALSYWLNRALNFESHGAVGGELVRYVGVVAVNYAAFVVGFSTLLHHLGVQFQLARVCAACVEAVFMYCCLRWVVFRRRDVDRGPGADAHPGHAEHSEVSRADAASHGQVPPSRASAPAPVPPEQ